MKFKYCSDYDSWKVYVNDFTKGSTAVIVEKEDNNIILAEVAATIICSNNPSEYYHIIEEYDDPATKFEELGVKRDYVVEFITNEDNYLVSFKIIDANDITAMEEC